jgi:tetratricopeptide (TPR) repeat protein
MGFHELARQYVAQKLAEAQAVATARNRHLTFFMHYAEEAEHHLLNGQQATWFDRLESEHDNLRAALEWSLTGGEFVAGLRMVGALYEFWLARGHARTGRVLAERFLADAQAAPRTLAGVKALHTIGVLNYYQGEHRNALAWLAESMAIARELGAEGRLALALAQGFTLMALADFSPAQRLSQATLRLGDELQNAWIGGSALHQVAWIAALQQDHDRARPSFVESIEYLKRAGHCFASMYPLCNLGIMLFEQEDYATAQPYLAQALAISREMGDKIYAATCCVYLAGIDLYQGDAVAAHRRWDEALALLRDVGDLRELANSLDDMGRLAQRHGDHARALAWHWESLTLHVQIGTERDIATALEALACLATRREEWLCAAQLFGAAAARFATFERPLDPPLRPVHDHLVGVTRAQLSTEVFTAAWAAGEAMTVEEAVALALAAAH